MTAEPAGHVMWTPHPIGQRLADHMIEEVPALTRPCDMRLPVRDLTP